MYVIYSMNPHFLRYYYVDSKSQLMPNRTSHCTQNWMLSMINSDDCRSTVDNTCPCPPSQSVANNIQTTVACLSHSTTVNVPLPIFPKSTYSLGQGARGDTLWGHPNSPKTKCRMCPITNLIHAVTLMQYRRVTDSPWHSWHTHTHTHTMTTAYTALA